MRIFMNKILTHENDFSFLRDSITGSVCELYLLRGMWRDYSIIHSH